MSHRCHLCGREGSRGFLEAIAATLVTWDSRYHEQAESEERVVLICAARRACNHRRGVSS